MAAVTDVTIASGIPTVGTGTVATLSKFEKAASTGIPAASDVALAVTVRDVNANGQTTGSGSAPVVPPSDYGFPMETSKMLNGTTTLTPKFSTIVASSSGATTIVAAVTSKKIRVLALKVTANAAVNIKWQSHVTPTDKTGLSYCGAQGDGEVLPFRQRRGWWASNLR
jgi:hypothetical protein